MLAASAAPRCVLEGMVTYRAGVLSHPVRESRGTLYTIALIGLTPAPFSPGSLSEGPKMSVGINVFKNYLVVFSQCPLLLLVETGRQAVTSKSRDN